MILNIGEEPPLILKRVLKNSLIVTTALLMTLLLGRGVLLAQIRPEAPKSEAGPTGISFEHLKLTVNDLANKTASIKLKQEQDRIRAYTIDKMEAIFAQYGGYMSGLADNLYDNALACGGDPLLLFAIAGNESGFGRIPYKYYNPFGYLDGVQYANWEEAINYLSCKIATQHLAPCGNEVYCVIRRYGGPDTPQALWIRNINFFKSLV